MDYFDIGVYIFLAIAALILIGAAVVVYGTSSISIHR